MTKRRVQGGEATSERRRRDGSQYFPLFVLFVLFGQAKRTLKEKNHNVTFPLSYFCMTKSTKSHLRGLFPPVSATPTNALRALVNSPLLKIFFRVHELAARAMRGKYVRHRTERKSVVLRSPQLHLYHACEHITRKSRADSCTHCLHAR